MKSQKSEVLNRVAAEARHLAGPSGHTLTSSQQSDKQMECKKPV